MALVEMNAHMVFLIIDHLEAHRELLSMTIKKMGYSKILFAASAHAALQILKNTKVEFVLCRKELPEVSGIALFEELKVDFTLPRIPFVIFGDTLDEADVALLMEYGVDGHLALPLTSKSLAQAIAQTWQRYIDPQSAEYVYEAGRRLFYATQLVEAENLFKKLIEQNKLVSRSLVAIARIAKRRSKYSDARKIAEQLIQNFPEYVHGYQLLGEIAILEEQPVEAVEAFSKAIMLSPKNPYRYETLGSILLTFHRWAELETLYTQAIQYEVKFSSLDERLAVALLCQKKYERAFPLYRTLVGQRPVNANHLNNYAICLHSLDKSKEALTIYGSAFAQTKGTNKRLALNYGLMLLWTGEKEKAKKVAEAVLMTDPASARAEKLQNGDAGKLSLEIAIPGSESAERLSFHEMERIGQVLGKHLNAQGRTATVPPLVLPSQAAHAIAGMNPEQIQVQYRQTLLTIHSAFLQLSRPWLIAVSDISEEVATTILDVISGILQGHRIEKQKITAIQESTSAEEINKAMGHILASAPDHALDERVSGIVMELQFQDYLRQSLESITRGYEVIFKQNSAQIEWNTVEKVLVTEEDRQLLRQIVSDRFGNSEKRSDRGDNIEDLRLWADFLTVFSKQIINNLERTATSLTNAFQDLVAFFASFEAAGNNIHAILRDFMNAQNGSQLLEVYKSLSDTNLSLKALFGMVHSLKLLKSRLQGFHAMIGHLVALHPIHQDPTAIRALFSQYGLDFDHFWTICRVQCRTAEEVELFDRIIKVRGIGKA